MPLLKSTTAKIGAITIGIAAMGGAVLYMPGLIRDDAAINDVESDRSVNVAEQTGPGERNIMIDLAGLDVPIEEGGLYDRFRSNPPLAVVAEERPDLDLSWFQTIEKQKKEVGFTTWSPNFYYSNSSITAI